ncbi:hypothetical protein C8R45DRAFT_1073728 [Mycena sanguinolenta]|nr:hypothetical protein C8R45DRAFT_1073728 [Mycena sanguinolenta]
MYLGSILARHITTPTLLSVETFNATRPDQVGTQSLPAYTWPSDLSPVSNGGQLEEYALGSFAFFPSVVETAAATGLSGGTLYDVPDANTAIGNVTVNATGFNITCGYVNDVTQKFSDYLGSDPEWDMLEGKGARGIISSTQAAYFTKSVVLYSTIPIIDSDNKLGASIKLLPPMNTSVAAVQLLRCSQSLVNQKAVVDSQSGHIIRVEPDIRKTISSWAPYPGPFDEPTDYDGTPLSMYSTGENLFLYAWGLWYNYLPSSDIDFSHANSDILFGFNAADAYLIQKLNLFPTDSGPPRPNVTLHELENALSIIVASMFWTLSRKPPGAPSSLNISIVKRPPTNGSFARYPDSNQSIPEPFLLDGFAEVTSNFPLGRLDVMAGLAASILLLLLSLPHSLLPGGQTSDDDDIQIDGIGLLHAIWLYRNHPELEMLLEQVEQPTTDNLRRAGEVRTRLVATRKNLKSSSVVIHYGNYRHCNIIAGYRTWNMKKEGNDVNMRYTQEWDGGTVMHVESSRNEVDGSNGREEEETERSNKKKKPVVLATFAPVGRGDTVTFRSLSRSRSLGDVRPVPLAPSSAETGKGSTSILQRTVSTYPYTEGRGRRERQRNGDNNSPQCTSRRTRPKTHPHILPRDLASQRHTVHAERRRGRVEEPRNEARTDARVQYDLVAGRAVGQRDGGKVLWRNTVQPGLRGGEPKTRMGERCGKDKKRKPRRAGDDDDDEGSTLLDARRPGHETRLAGSDAQRCHLAQRIQAQKFAARRSTGVCARHTTYWVYITARKPWMPRPAPSQAKSTIALRCHDPLCAKAGVPKRATCGCAALLRSRRGRAKKKKKDEEPRPQGKEKRRRDRMELTQRQGRQACRVDEGMRIKEIGHRKRGARNNQQKTREKPKNRKNRMRTHPQPFPTSSGSSVRSIYTHPAVRTRRAPGSNSPSYPAERLSDAAVLVLLLLLVAFEACEEEEDAADGGRSTESDLEGSRAAGDRRIKRCRRRGGTFAPWPCRLRFQPPRRPEW